MLPKFNWWWLVTALGLSLGSLAALFLVTVQQNMWGLLAMLRPPLFLAALAVVGLAWSVDALRLQAILAAMGEKLAFREVLALNISTNFIAAITPAATGGPPAQGYFLYRRGVPAAKAAAVVAVRLILTFTFFALVVSIILLSYRNSLNLRPFLADLILIAVAAIFSIILGAVYVITHQEIFLNLMQRFFKFRFWQLFLARPDEMAGSLYLRVVNFVQGFKLVSAAGPLTVLKLVAYTFLYWSLFFSIAPVLLRGLDIQVPLLSTVIRQVVYYFLISYVPLPGGSGVAELGLATLFSSMLPTSLLAGFIGGWRFLTYYLNILVGALVFLRFSRLPAREDSG